MSSRNTYLNEEERKQATILNQALAEGEKAFLAGETAVQKLVSIIADKIKEMPLAEIDYVDIYDFPSLTEIKKVEHQALAAVAVKFGKTRLIDNRILGEE